MNLIAPYGAAIALSMDKPPAASAGKNLTMSRPSSIAASMSEGLEQPGKNRHADLLAMLYGVRVESGAYDKLRTGRFGGIGLFSVQNGACTDYHVRICLSNCLDGRLLQQRCGK